MKGGWGREDKNYYNDGITFILMRNSSTPSLKCLKNYTIHCLKYFTVLYTPIPHYTIICYIVVSKTEDAAGRGVRICLPLFCANTQFNCLHVSLSLFESPVQAAVFPTFSLTQTFYTHTCTHTKDIDIQTKHVHTHTSEDRCTNKRVHKRTESFTNAFFSMRYICGSKSSPGELKCVHFHARQRKHQNGARITAIAKGSFNISHSNASVDLLCAVKLFCLTYRHFAKSTETTPLVEQTKTKNKEKKN